MSALHFVVERGCNNGCRGCLWTRAFDILPGVGVSAPETVRGRGIRLAGREPTLRADLREVVSGLIAAGATGVEIETNGRMLGYPKYVAALRDAGVTRLVIKLFGRDAASWEAHTRVPGSFAQTVRGIEITRRVAPRIDLVALAVPRRVPGAGVHDLVACARELGFRRVRVELRVAKLDLTALPALATEVRQLRDHPPAGMQIDVSTP